MSVVQPLNVRSTTWHWYTLTHFSPLVVLLGQQPKSTSLNGWIHRELNNCFFNSSCALILAKKTATSAVLHSFVVNFTLSPPSPEIFSPAALIKMYLVLLLLLPYYSTILLITVFFSPQIKSCGSSFEFCAFLVYISWEISEAFISYSWSETFSDSSAVFSSSVQLSVLSLFQKKRQRSCTPDFNVTQTFHMLSLIRL